MKKKVQVLTLNKETLRSLDAGTSLIEVKGGFVPADPSGAYGASVIQNCTSCG